MKTLVLSLWGLAISLRAVALLRVLFSGVGLVFLPLIIFLAGGLVQSLYLVYAMKVGNYAAAWYATQWVGFAIQAILAIGAFHAIAQHFKNAYPFALGLMGVMSLIGVAAIWLSWFTASPTGRASSALFLTRHGEIFWGVFVILGVGFYIAQFQRVVAISPNAQDNAMITIGYFAVSFAASSLMALKPYWSQVAGQILLQVGLMGCFGAWAILITKAGAAPPAVEETISDEEAMEGEAQLQRLLAKSRGAGG